MNVISIEYPFEKVLLYGPFNLEQFGIPAPKILPNSTIDLLSGIQVVRTWVWVSEGEACA